MTSTTRGAPAPGTMLGREADLARLAGALRRHRLVTVTGPGGVGKTRLVREAVHEPGGLPAVICELASVRDPSGVPSVIAESLGFPDVTAAAAALGDQPRLLVLDNAEHLLDAVAASVERLRAAGPRWRLLVTSREPLDVPGEQVLVLAPLPVPDDDADASIRSSPAVQLFLQRATEAGATPSDDPTTARTVAAIARRLDGLPLAIELAAARTRSLDPRDILRHLDARFELLTRRRDRGPERHRSLEAAIDWSYDRLEPGVQRFFASLGAFSGPFPVAAAHTVAGGPDTPETVTIDRLDILVNRSLLSVGERAGDTVYWLPETIRLYARRQLEASGELAPCDARCIDHYVGVAASLVTRGAFGWSAELFQQVQVAQANLQDAVRRCLLADPDPDRATILFAPLWGLVHNGRAEKVFDLGEQILRRWPDGSGPVWDMAVATTATAALLTDRPQRAEDLLAGVLAGGERGVGFVLAARADHLVALRAGDPARAAARLAEAIEVADTLALVAFTIELRLFAALLEARTDAAAALVLVDEALARTAAGDSPILQVFGALVRGAVTAVEDPDRARTVIEEAIALAEATGYPWGIGAGWRALGAAGIAAGDVAGAATALH
ncbi:MAG TPA: hypothetical protein VK906_02955, partial [Egicoccus sp.]